MENINLIARHWHHLPIAEVIELLEGNKEQVLERFAVEHRLETFGPNTITAKKGQGAINPFPASVPSTADLYPYYLWFYHGLSRGAGRLRSYLRSGTG
jgi:hypothetical protein